MICQKCSREFLEKFIHESHDIPKYLGGTDLDGRHNLCEECHNQYDKLIVIGCLNFLGETLESDEEIIQWQMELKKQPEKLKEEFRKIARKICDDFFKKSDGGC